jgi:hypothetical protein
MKAKLVILVIVTLAIGFLLGMLTSAQVRYQKLKPVKVYFSEDRFRDGFYKVIQPDEEQKEKIDPILKKYARISSKLQDDFRKELDSSMKAFKKDIDPLLTEDQLMRLKEMDEAREEMIRQRRQRHEDEKNQSIDNK